MKCQQCKKKIRPPKGFKILSGNMCKPCADKRRAELESMSLKEVQDQAYAHSDLKAAIKSEVEKSNG